MNTTGKMEVQGYGWINIYRDRNTGRTYTHDAIHFDRKLAKRFGSVDKDYVCTIKIKWTEKI